MSDKMPVFKGEILVCDDTEMIQQFMRSILLKIGLDVTVANNGKECADIALGRIESGAKPFELIFLDMYMPVMDGLETAGILREAGNQAPVVAMTSNVKADDRECYGAHGVIDVLSKPFSMEDVLACLQKHLTPVKMEIQNPDEEEISKAARHKRLLAKFVQGNQTMFRDIEAAIRAGDVRCAHRLAHMLGGMAGHIGKTALRETARMIEFILAEGTAEGTEKYMSVLESELSQVLEELSPLLCEAKPCSTETRTLDRGEARMVFGQLEPLLRIDSARSLTLTKKLNNIPETETLIAQIEDYDFDLALKTLDSLRNSLGVFGEVAEDLNEARRILIVDDEINNIDALCGILSPLYDVIVAKNGASVIEKAIKYMPDLILLDVIMPDMTGFEVIARIKDLDITRKIPVIFITGLYRNEDEEKGLLLGAVDYITKPFHGSIVKARVQTHLKISEYIDTIERLCRVDALTNIPNRRGFNDQMILEWRRCARDRKPLSMLMIDIDHFKKYNDKFGHPQGDNLLKEVSAIFSQSLHRSGDFVSRWGGEEFAVLLPDTDLEDALEMAERIRSSIECFEFPGVDGAVTKVTVSIGANSILPTSDGDIEDFISIADQMLYVAKKSGRNCVGSSKMPV